MTAVNGQKAFAAGRFFGINNVVVPTPTRFSVPQDQSIDFKRSGKSLFGENQLAEDVCSGTMEISGKVTMGTLNARMFADLLFGVTGVAGQINIANSELQAIPGAGPYTVAVTNAGTWTVNLGVRNLTTGLMMVRVAAGPVTGQYSVAAGTYTFAAADANTPVAISYQYTVATPGELVTITNQPMGKIGNFTAVMQFVWGTEQSVLTLNNNIATDTGLATKLDDYTKPTFGFMSAVDTTGQLGTMSFAEAA